MMLNKSSAQEKVEEDLHQKLATLNTSKKKKNCVLYNASTVVPKFLRKGSLIRLPNILCEYFGQIMNQNPKFYSSLNQQKWVSYCDLKSA